MPTDNSETLPQRYQRETELDATMMVEHYPGLAARCEKLEAENKALETDYLRIIAAQDEKHREQVAALQAKITRLNASGVPGGCKVSGEGVQFGNAWYSHERITQKSADQLNNGECGLTARQYMEWVRAMLSAAPAPTGEPAHSDVVQVRRDLQDEAEHCAFVLESIAALDAEEITDDDIDLRFEDSEGRDTGCDISIVEYAERTAKLLRALLAGGEV
jgi:hypothetical protein